jgi:hypothetical protein
MITSSADFFGDGDEAVGLHLDLDPVGVAGQRLVHGIVDDFGEQVVQRLLVGAADIHAGTPAHRLEAFEHLDVLRRITGLGGGAARRADARASCSGAPRFAGIAEQVGRGGRLGGFRCFSHALPRVLSPACYRCGVAPGGAQWRRISPDYDPNYAI